MLKHRFLGPTPRAADSVGGMGSETLHFTKLPGDANAVSSKALGDSCLMLW